MTGPLAQMGMPLAFTAFQADFSGIDGSGDLYISAVIHQAYVDVNESGTTAAAATGVVVPHAQASIPPPPDFTVDHAFLFAIVDNTSNAALFMGRVDDPLSSQ